MKKVLHIINGLHKGGAETMLYNILKYNKSTEIEHTILTFLPNGYYQKKIEELGIKVILCPIGKKPISSIIKLRKAIVKSDVVNCIMYVSNYLGYLMSRFTKKKIIWNIRHANLDKEVNSNRTLKVSKKCIKYSGKVDIIAYNGERAKELHEAIGYDSSKSLVLVNGCDFNEYSYKDNAKELLVKELGIESSKKIICSVGRYHKIKDAPLFIKSLGLLKKERNDIVGIMCGTGIDSKNEELMQLIKLQDLEIGKDIYLLGQRHDIPNIFSASDMFVLHSAGEAFPNVLLQAVACKCMSITTDAGDACKIVYDQQCMIEGHESTAVKDKILEFIDRDNKEVINKNFEFVKENYDIEKVADFYINMMLS